MRYWVLGALLVAGLPVAVFGVRWATAEPLGKLGAREQIQSGASRIQAYDHFFDVCAAVQAAEAALDAQRSSLEEAEGRDAARIRANVAGLEAERARAIAQYNADAAKNYTVGQFRASKLPYQLDTAPYDGKEKTTCVAYQ